MNKSFLIYNSVDLTPLFDIYPLFGIQSGSAYPYNITISKKNETVIKHLGVFNYYLSKENKNMNFEFKNKNQDDEIISLLTLYLIG